MKVYRLFLICMGALALSACSSNDEATSGTPSQTQLNTTQLVVPCGCKEVRIDYTTASGVKSVLAPVTPTVNAGQGMQPSSITNATLKIASAAETYITVYDDSDNVLVENLHILKTTGPTSEANVQLPEDAVAKYITEDGPFTFYHSSGVAMFDDSWPNRPIVGGVDADYNDVVVDYDIETKSVNDIAANANEAWREQCKVVMHLRAIGGGFPSSVGLLLEGLDTKYIKSDTAIITLGNKNTNIPANSITATVDLKGDHPVIKMNNLWWVHSSGAQTFQYPNSKTGVMQVFNRSTIDPAYTEDNTPKYYNVNRGYVNVGGDLFTLTVIFRGTLRSEMDKAEGDAQIKNYIDAVINTNTQNFFIVTTKGYEIHMKGYQPTTAYTTYDTDKVKGNATMTTSTTYATSDNLVWGFKTPVLTRHAWEKTSFYKAYPDYTNFVTSGGTTNTDWYNHPVEDNITCWW